MAWRFKPSKYKNAAPVVPKREQWIRDVDVGSPSCSGMPIAASAALMAFVVKNRSKLLDGRSQMRDGHNEL